MVWVPKYRKLVLKGGLAKRLKEVFKETANLLGTRLALK
jgi:REP element-mobilizing transposase RayT